MSTPVNGHTKAADGPWDSLSVLATNCYSKSKTRMTLIKVI